MSLMLGRWLPVMFLEVLIIHCRAVLSWAVGEPCQIVMFPVRMFSIAPLQKLFGLALTFSLLVFSQKVDDKFSMMLIPPKKLSTCSTSAPPM